MKHRLLVCSAVSISLLSGCGTEPLTREEAIANCMETRLNEEHEPFAEFWPEAPVQITTTYRMSGSVDISELSFGKADDGGIRPVGVPTEGTDDEPGATKGYESVQYLIQDDEIYLQVRDFRAPMREALEQACSRLDENIIFHEIQLQLGDG